MPPVWSEEERIRWTELVVSERLFTSETVCRYADPETRAHYDKVAGDLDCFGDPDLTIAAFLHGLADHEANELAALGIISKDCALMIHGRRRLRSLTEHEATVDLAQELTRNVLPSVQDLRSAVLLVAEQVRHADLDLAGRDFALSFHENPPTTVPSIRSSQGNHVTRLDQARFLQVVCAGTARYLGMWPLRNLSEDLGLYLENPAHLQRVLDCVNGASAKEAVREAEKLVASTIDRSNLEAMRWEWHHAASIHRKLGPKGNIDISNVHLFGMMTVTCKLTADCYHVLHDLHNSKQCLPIPNKLEDHFALRHRSRYEALHTEVAYKDRCAPVRIIPAEGDKQRFALFDAMRYRAMRNQVPSENESTITVFSPMGKPVRLPRGSTVLNLAAAVHTDLLPRAESATINSVPGRSVFAPLKNGDVVKVNFVLEPRLLPPDWKSRVPERFWTTVTEAFRQGYKSALETAGRAIVRRRLLDELGGDFDDGGDDGVIDAIVEQAGEALVERHEGSRKWPRDRGSRYWLRQIALCDVKDPTELLIPNRHFVPLRDTLFNLMLEELRRAPTISLMDHVKVPEALGEFDNLDPCSICKPKRGEQVCGRIEGRVLKIHRVGAECAAGCTPVEWRTAHRYGVYVVLHAKDRVGLATDVLSAAAELSIDVIEHIGCPLGDTAVVRLCVRQLSKRQYRELYQRLDRIQGVTRILGPDDPPVPFLEGSLPPRHSALPNVYRSFTPYSTGAEIKLDYQFYGRTREYTDLLTYLTNTSLEKGTGTGVILRGPLRYGKSSLLRKFIHGAEARFPKTAGVYGEFSKYGWNDFLLLTERIYRRLGVEGPLQPGPKGLIAAIDKLTRSFDRVIIGIDEAVGLMAMDNRGTTDVLSCFHTIRAMPGVMLVLSVFDLGLRRLDLEPSAWTKFEMIKLGPLNISEASALIRATQHRPDLGVIASDDVARYVHRLTGGNPYWLSLIANELYKRYRPGTPYSGAQVDEAAFRLLEDPIWLQDRDRDLQPMENEIVGLVLERGPMDSSEMRVFLPSNRSLGEIDDALSSLEAGGLIRRESNAGKWGIAAPLLAQYLNRKRGRGVANGK